MASRLIPVKPEFISDDEVLNEKGALTPTTSSVDELSEKVPPLGVPIDTANQGGFSAIFSYYKRPKVNLDAIATQPSVFDNPITLKAYIPPPSYENSHRFNVLARWTWREEKVSSKPTGVCEGYS